MTWQKPVPHSISNRLEGIKAEKYGPKLIMLANSFYAYRRRKRTSSSPGGRLPSSLIKFSPEERTVCVMHQIIYSSRTHGTRPDSEDSTPSAELCVRLLTYALPFFKLCPLSLFFFLFIALKASSMLRPHTSSVLCVLNILGGFLYRSLIYLSSGLHAQNMRDTSA